MSATKHASVLTDWHPEEKFAALLQKKTGFGSRVTLARWRRLGTVPEGLKWKRFGRAVMWREDMETAQTG